LTAAVLASGFPPGVDAFYPPAIWDFHLLGMHFEITRITIINWIVCVILIGFLVAASRKTEIVPGKLQFVGESIYGFVRGGIARDVIGPQGIKYAPYLSSLFMFILLNNIMGIIPFAQIAPTAKFAIPLILAVMSYVLYLAVGIKRHGLWGYLKGIIYVPEAPLALQPLMIPLEIFQKLISRPATLAIRLFANMFAGHLLLLVFMLGGVALMNGGIALKAAGVVSWIFAIGMTFFELLVEVLQAYVFTLLVGTYLQESVSGGH
jgi:F-type H+-transporting ATPase subunit a